MKPNNTGKEMWQRAQTANQKLKQNAQTHDADSMQAISVLYYMTLLILYLDSNTFHGSLTSPVARTP